MNIVGPFPGKQFKVQTLAMNRSRPSISVNFNIPFDGLCHGMQVMRRSGFSVTHFNPGTVQNDLLDQSKTGERGLTTKRTQKSPTQSATPKSGAVKSEVKAENTKTSDKKTTQKAKRQRRK